jgi:hypothetical protein
MKKKVPLAALLVLMASIALLTVAQERTERSSPQTTHVQGHGCVKLGKVPGCYVVNDYRANRKYNVFFRSEKPDIDTGISFEGIAYGHGDPHCNQGQKVDIAEWKPLAGECPQRSQNR